MKRFILLGTVWSLMVFVMPALCPAALTAEIDGQPGYASGTGILAVPGQTIQIRLMAGGPDAAKVLTKDGGQMASSSIVERYEWSVDGGRLLNITGRGLVLECPPTPGTVKLSARQIRSVTVQSAQSGESEDVQEATWTLSALVQYTFDLKGDGTLDGFPIGIYPDENAPTAPYGVRSAPDRYAPPTHFVRVAQSDRNFKISKYFTLGDFCTLYNDEDPTFLVIQQRLIDKLDALQAHLHANGFANKKIHIIRAYLSPNKVARLERQGLSLSEFSRHKYGDAAAIVVDGDGDQKMDDLNGDGRVNAADTDLLAGMVEQVERDLGQYGGLGICDGPIDDIMPDTPHVVLDCRGIRQRWHLSGKTR